jgi:hypothetical protein
MRLVYYYEDGDSNGNGKGNCLQENEVGQGGERGNGRMGLLLSFLIYKIVVAKMDRGKREKGVECSLDLQYGHFIF